MDSVLIVPSWHPWADEAWESIFPRAVVVRDERLPESMDEREED